MGTYDHVKEIRDNVAKLKKSYYRYLKDIAASNAHKFHGDLGIDQIKNKRNRRAANNAFESYCNPFVVSPWVPTPNPTSWKVSTLHQLEEPHQDKALIENKFILVQKF